MMAKRLLDILGSAAGIVILSPLLLGLAIAIKLTSKGPVFFVQERIGLKGSVFKMLKFRSMVENAEHLGTGLFSHADDPRITRVGHFIRKTSLDELPQLFNVFGGSMSLVGPRPPVTYELGPFEDYTPVMRRRFDVKPGITGLAQVSGRNELEWDDKIVFDNQYVDQYEARGVLVDLVILIRTIGVVLSGRDTVEDVSSSQAPKGEIAAKAAEAGSPGSASQIKSEGQ